MDHQSPDEDRDELETPPEPDPDPGFYARAQRRIPRWMALATAVGLPLVWWKSGPLGGASFLAGAIGGYWNYIAICRVADRIAYAADPALGARRFRLRSMIRLAFLGAAVFAIIRFTHINLAAALMGLFTPVAAVMLEILFELGVHNRPQNKL
jgi:hypothetical protein